VITGLSGSGKSSLAFDTIYAEGQRRYVESLSAYARQFLGIMEKPDVDVIDGLSPAISIEQKTTGRNPRSTVGTVTEIYDYLRLLWARSACRTAPTCGRPVRRQSATQIVDQIMALAGGHAHRGAGAAGARPQGRVPRPLRGRAQEGLRARPRGRRAARPGVAAEAEPLREPRHRRRRGPPRRARGGPRSRLADSVETALRTANGIVEVRGARRRAEDHLFSERYACVHCGTSMAELEPRQFSFNSPYGACEGCGGLGTRREVSPTLVVGDPIISILEGVILPWGEPTGHLRKTIIPGLAEHYGFDPEHAVGRAARRRARRDPARLRQEEGEVPVPAGRRGRQYSEPWEGVLANVMRRYEETTSETVREQLEEFMMTLPCRTCGGSRLKPESLAVTVAAVHRRHRAS
jgi:excinuclease ABC subunit A